MGTQQSEVKFEAKHFTNENVKKYRKHTLPVDVECSSNSIKTDVFDNIATDFI